MTPPLPLAVRLLLDAQDTLLAAIDHLPAPGRGGPLGRLNAPGWVVAHLASSHDLWINVLVGGGERHPWAARWSEAQQAPLRGQQAAAPVGPSATSLGEARAAFLQIATRVAEVATSLDAAALSREVATPRGVVTAGYLVARAPAHLFGHAGELAVIGALVTAAPLDLPGALARVAGEVAAAAETEAGADRPPLVVRLLLDAQDEFIRAADALPAPAVFGALPRLRSGIETVAAVTDEVAGWQALGGEGRAGASDPPATWDEACASFRAAVSRVRPRLEALRPVDLARPHGDRTLGAAVAGSVGLLFARAGELNAIASLFGAPDLAQPGALAHVAERGQ